MLSKKNVVKRVWRFITTRVSLFVITFLVVISAIVLAGYATVLNGETKPVLSWTIEVSRWQKVHDFVNSRTTDWSGGLMTPWSLIVKWILGVFDPLAWTFAARDRADAAYRTRLYVDGNGVITDNLFVGGKTKTSKVFIYWWLQLSTIAYTTAYASCNTGAIGTIRLRMPTNIVSTESYCPLELCYPGNQTNHTNGVSRKSACDPVTFPAAISRTGVWIDDAGYTAE